MMHTASEIQKIVAKFFAATDTSKLYYHSLNHTLAVSECVKKIVSEEKQSDKICNLMEISALLHDVGYLYTYHHHEDKGIELARAWMPQWGYDSDSIDFICSMIEATKLSHQPTNPLEAIISE
jgi:uncharacterized protein